MNPTFCASVLCFFFFFASLFWADFTDFLLVRLRGAGQLRRFQELLASTPRTRASMPSKTRREGPTADCGQATCGCPRGSGVKPVFEGLIMISAPSEEYIMNQGSQYGAVIVTATRRRISYALVPRVLNGVCFYQAVGRSRVLLYIAAIYIE